MHLDNLATNAWTVYPSYLRLVIGLVATIVYLDGVVLAAFLESK